MRRRVWAAVLLTLFILLGLPAFARAEEGEPAEEAARAGEAEQVSQSVDLSGWQQLADEGELPLNLRELMNQFVKQNGFDWTALVSTLAGYLGGLVAASWPNLLMLVGPALLWAVNRQVFSDGYALSDAAGYVCYLVEASVLVRLFAGQLEAARAAVSQISRLIEQASPVLTALTVAVGGTGTAAGIQPMAVMASAMIAAVVDKAAFLLCGIAAVLAVAGNLSERVKLNGLFKLTKSSTNWIMGAAMTAFLGVMTIHGMMGAVRDSISIRTAKYTVDNLLPVVGGEVADTLDAMVLSALLVKNAAGVTGLILLAGICLKPVAGLVITLVMCRLSAALVEPISDGPLSRLMGQFADVCQMLLVALSTCLVLFVVLVGVVLASGNAIAMLR